MKNKIVFRFLIISSAILFMVSSAWAGWVSAPSMQEFHGNLAGAIDKDGRIYAIGGRNDAYNTLIIDGKVERFDEHTGLWSYTTPLNTPRACLGAATDLQGKIYAVGGYISSDTIVNTVERFDPSTDTWTSVASMNIARAAAGVVTDQFGRIYAIGGSSQSGGVLSSVERYDPLLDQWDILTANLPGPRQNGGAALGADGAIYVIGGHDGSSWLNSVLKYSSALDTWTEVAPISSSRVVAAAITGPDGYIYAISGYSEPYTNIVQLYDPFTNSWSDGPSVISARNNSGAAVTPSGYIYVFGGDISYHRTDTVEKLYVVPEPATILLLTLGGITLRLRSGQVLRKKR